SLTVSLSLAPLTVPLATVTEMVWPAAVVVEVCVLEDAPEVAEPLEVVAARLVVVVALLDPAQAAAKRHDTRTAQIVSSFFTSATALSAPWSSRWGASTACCLCPRAPRLVPPVDQRGAGEHENEGEAAEADRRESFARGDGGRSGRARQDVGRHEVPGG